MTAAGTCWPLSLAAQTVKVGLINSYTGFVAQAADQGQKAIDLYLKLHEKDLPQGVKLEIIKRDDTSSPEVGKRLAQELIARERVQLLTGVVLSPVAAAIAPLTAEAKVPLLISIAAAGVQIPRISPYVARVTFTLWQQGYPIGKWAAEQGWKKGYTAVSDFIPGHDTEASFAKGFTEGGGQIIGAVRMPPQNPDFVPFLQRIKDAKPDVACFFVPADPQATALIKAIRDLGLREAGINIAGPQDLLPDEALPNMGDTPLGIVTSGIYSVAGKRPANEAFVAAWNEEYGNKSVPDFLSVDAWDGMVAVFDLIKATKGKFTGDEAMDFFKKWKNPDSPRGPVEIDPATRDVVQNIYIRRAEKVDGKLANIEIATIPMVKDPWKELNPPK
ncbi:MAG: branched-chain amino acid ABC transporter substrate-binding protein [Proteobacteria bacterium]|nr:MAG: branched-chain amino acid ABC transporter substrate-binding protein [Pseudomonadota bacterium]